MPVCYSRCLAFHCDDGERDADRRRVGSAGRGESTKERARSSFLSLSLFPLPFTPSLLLPWLDLVVLGCIHTAAKDPRPVRSVSPPPGALLSALRPELTSHTRYSEAPLPPILYLLPSATAGHVVARAGTARLLASSLAESSPTPPQIKLSSPMANTPAHTHTHTRPSPNHNHDEIASYTLTRVKRLAVSIPYVGRDSQRLILQANTEPLPSIPRVCACACACACACVHACICPSVAPGRTARTFAQITLLTSERPRAASSAMSRVSLPRDPPPRTALCTCSLCVYEKYLFAPPREA